MKKITGYLLMLLPYVFTYLYLAITTNSILITSFFVVSVLIGMLLITSEQDIKIAKLKKKLRQYEWR